MWVHDDMLLMVVIEFKDVFLILLEEVLVGVNRGELLLLLLNLKQLLRVDANIFLVVFF